MNKTINRLARTVAAVVLTLNLTGIAPFLTQPAYAATAGDLDQWANTDLQWQNGNLGQANSKYREGDSVPYRLKMTDVPTVGTNTVVIEWDIYKSSTHALDYITSYDRTTSPNPCAGIAGCGSATTFPIPLDTLTVTPYITQIPGNLTLFNGSITSATYNNPQSGDARSMTITFTAATSTPVLAWAGHIASQIDWGVGNSASAISGSPYHTRLISINGGGGNQDRSLSADAISPTPVMSTTASASSIYLGQSVTDSVSVTGDSRNSVVPAGTVTFYACGPSASNPDCSNGGIQVGSAITLVNGAGVSSAYTPSTVGKYCFRAEYAPAAGAPYSPQEHTNITTECFTVVQGTSTVTLVKSVVNNFGGVTAGVNEFGLTIAGQPVVSGQAVTVNAGTTVALNEAGKTGYQFTSITGTGCPASLGGTVTPAINQSIVCTITNTSVQPKITVVKAIVGNQYGDTSSINDFGLTIGGVSAVSGTTYAKNVGTYAINEAGKTGYSFVNITGDAKCPAILNGNVSLALGDDITCTIHNQAIAPVVTLKKIAINNDGGTVLSGLFNLHAGANSFTGGTSIVDPNDATKTTTSYVTGLGVGTYILSEDSVTGYAANSWTCTSGLNGSTITVALGSDITCTITNEDVAPFLTIVKQVLNPYGTALPASSFPLFVDNISVTSGVATSQFNAGTHTVTETQQTGYTFASFTGTNCSYTDGIMSVLLSLAGNTTCTITNTAIQPQLTVIKHVINDNGGTATASQFEMQVTGTNVSDAAFPGNEDGTTVTLNAGAFSVAESGPGGYGASLSNDCGYSIAVGQHKVCTITNNDIAPSLTLNKVVSNTHGGTAAESAWTLTASGPTLLSGAGATGDTDVVSGSTFAAGTYTLSESTGPAGYSASVWTCTNNVAVVNSMITLAPGQPTACSITNSDVAPKLTVTKVVTNDNGGSKVISDFPLLVNQTSVTSGVQNGFNTGSYTISETSDPGYESSITGDCSGNGEITLNLGDVKSCTITNNDIAPKLKLVKTVINDNGGTKQVSDFALYINGNQVTSGEPNVLLANTLYTATETTQTGYAPSAWGGDCAANGTVTLAPGDTKTCTITNDDVAAKLTLVKTVTNDNGGTNVAADFQAKVDGNNVAWSTQVSLSAGQHLASEVSLPTYTASVWGGDCATNGTITLLPGDVKSCSITNDDKTPSLTLNKILVDSFGGSYTEASWLLTADGAVTDLSGNGAAGSTDVVSGTGFYAGSYTLSESGPTTGITSGSWNCGDTVVTSNVIAIALGQVVTCTITNTTVQPKITLVKAIVGNQYGDTSSINDFGLTIGGSAATSGTAYGKNVGTYALNEAGKTGYSFVNITGDAKCPATLGGTVSLALGDDITCTITNTAIQPKLTVTKIVTNDNGGSKVISDFPLFVNQTSVTSGVQNGFNTGSYTVSETNQTGYVGTIGGDCSTNGSISLSLGDVKTCTITNDDIAPKLTLYKEVVNDNSGVSEAVDWTLTATPAYDDEEQTGNTLSGNGENGFISKEVSSHVTYTLSESGPDGYTAGDWDCYSEGTGVVSNPEGYNNQIRMSEGADVTCTITNNDNPNPALNVVKTGPKSSVAGSTVTYTFTVTNTGDVALNGLTVVDSITGDGTYVSGDTDDDDMLDLTETWVYSAKYTIPANQVAPVVNTVTVCAYEQRVKVCDTDKHTLTIPQVLSTSTSKPKLVNAGSPLLNMYTVAALVNIAAVLTLVAFNKKQNTKTTK